MGQGASVSVDSVIAAAKQKAVFLPPLGPPSKANPKVYMDVAVQGQALGRIVMELKADVVPKTAENFLQLCKKPAGKGFKSSVFHRVIPNFMCQGGDFTRGDGTGGVSIYGKTFADENFDLRHLGAGVLSMANAGPNTNGSQFFLCTAQTSWLDGKHVVFGQVIEGYEVVKALEACGSRDGDTAFYLTVADCGELPAGVSMASGAAAAKGSAAGAMRSMSTFTSRTPMFGPMPSCRQKRTVAPVRRAALSSVIRASAVITTGSKGRIMARPCMRML